MNLQVAMQLLAVTIHNRIINQWNSLPYTVINAQSVNDFLRTNWICIGQKLDMDITTGQWPIN